MMFLIENKPYLVDCISVLTHISIFNFSVILVGAFQISLAYPPAPFEKTRNFSRTWKDLTLQNDQINFIKKLIVLHELAAN